MLNIRLPGLDDWQKEDYWCFSVADNMYSTGFFASLDYVLRKTKNKERFNLLAVVKKPAEDCKGIRLDGFDLVGYDLLDIKFFIT